MFRSKAAHNQFWVWSVLEARFSGSSTTISTNTLEVVLDGLFFHRAEMKVWYGIEMHSKVQTSPSPPVLCIYVSVCMCCAQVQVRGWYCIFLNHLPTVFLRQVSHCTGAHCVASCKPRKPSGSPCLYYRLHLGHRYTGTLSFHTGAEDLNSGLYACAASILPTKSSPQHQSITSDHIKQKDKLCYQVSRDLQFPIKLCLEHWLLELLKKLS